MLIIICLTKQTLLVTCQCGYGVVPGCCADPVSGYQMLSSYFYVSQVLRQTYIETMQPRPFEEWIEIFMRLFLSFFVNYDHVTERTQARPFEDES